MRGGTKTQTCDEHANRVAGCLECRRRARNYEKGRELARRHGIPTSAPADLVSGWIRQLRAAGYSLPHLAQLTGLREKQLWELSQGGLTFVQLRTYHAVERVYRELYCFPGPSSRAAGIARRRGWTPPPPLPMPVDEELHGANATYIVDEVVVERLMDGERVRANKWERIEAVRRLLAKGLSEGQIAERVRASSVRVREIISELDEKATA